MITTQEEIRLRAGFHFWALGAVWDRRFTSSFVGSIPEAVISRCLIGNPGRSVGHFWNRRHRVGAALPSSSLAVKLTPSKSEARASCSLPDRSEVEQQDATPTIAELEAQGVVSRGMPEKGKTCSAGRGE